MAVLGNTVYPFPAEAARGRAMMNKQNKRIRNRFILQKTSSQKDNPFSYQVYSGLLGQSQCLPKMLNPDSWKSTPAQNTLSPDHCPRSYTTKELRPYLFHSCNLKAVFLFPIFHFKCRPILPSVPHPALEALSYCAFLLPLPLEPHCFCLHSALPWFFHPSPDTQSLLLLRNLQTA